jgi:hypothetical protein
MTGLHAEDKLGQTKANCAAGQDGEETLTSPVILWIFWNLRCREQRHEFLLALALNASLLN